MNARSQSIVVVALALSCAVLAQSPSPMRPGNWELSTKVMIAGAAMDMPPMKQTTCITEEMIKNPEQALAQIPGAECKVSDYKLQASTATYKLTCTQPPITAVGEVKYAGPDAYTGTVTVNMADQQMTFSTDAKRIGECVK